MLQMIHAYLILVTNFKGRRSLGRFRHVWDDNIKMDLRGINWAVIGFSWPTKDSSSSFSEQDDIPSISKTRNIL
jgi:hypothetical protein